MNYYKKTMQEILKSLGLAVEGDRLYQLNKTIYQHPFTSSYYTLKELDVNISKRTFEMLSLIYFMNYKEYLDSPEEFEYKISQYI